MDGQCMMNALAQCWYWERAVNIGFLFLSISTFWSVQKKKLYAHLIGAVSSLLSLILFYNYHHAEENEWLTRSEQTSTFLMHSVDF